MWKKIKREVEKKMRKVQGKINVHNTFKKIYIANLEITEWWCESDLAFSC